MYYEQFTQNTDIHSLSCDSLDNELVTGTIVTKNIIKPAFITSNRIMQQHIVFVNKNMMKTGNICTHTYKAY